MLVLARRRLSKWRRRPLQLHRRLSLPNAISAVHGEIAMRSLVPRRVGPLNAQLAHARRSPQPDMKLQAPSAERSAGVHSAPNGSQSAARGGDVDFDSRTDGRAVAERPLQFSEIHADSATRGFE